MKAHDIIRKGGKHIHGEKEERENKNVEGKHRYPRT